MSVLAARRNALLIRNRNRQSQSNHHQNHHHHHHNYRNQQDINATTDQQSSIGPLSQRAECEKNCTRNFTARSSAGCIRKCAMQYKILAVTNTNRTTNTYRNSNNLDSITISVNNSSKNKINGEKESNTIADELLETEESQSTGLYFVPNTGNSKSKSIPLKYAPNNLSPFDTKETENNNNATTTTATTPSGTINIATLSNQFYKNNSYKNNVIENEVRQSSTEKIFFKFLRTTLDARHKRIDPAVTAAIVAKARQKSLQTTLSPSSTSAQILITSEKSVEDSDLAPYVLFGQKLSGSKTGTEIRNQTIIESIAVVAAKPLHVAKLKSNEDLIIVESSKPVVSERSNKFRRFNPHNRNIVALSRKYGGTIPKDVWEAAGNNPIDTVITPKIPLSDSVEDIKLPSDLKILNLTMETINDTATEPTNNTPIFEPLLIQVPDIASRFGEDFPQAQSPTHNDINITTKIVQQMTNDTEPPEISHEPANIETKLPENVVTPKEINYPVNRHQPEEIPNLIVFLKPQNVTVQTQINEKQPDLLKVIANNVQPYKDIQVEAVTPNELKAFTRTTVSSSIRSTVNPVDQNDTVDSEIMATETNLPTTQSTKTTEAIETTTLITTQSTKQILSTLPHELTTLKTSTNTPPSETLSPTLSTIKTTVTPPEATTIFNLSAIFPNFSGINGNIPTLPDMSTIFIPDATNNTTKKPVIMVDGVILTNSNDVTIEMHRMNMATYVLAGLGMFPIIIIVLYVIKTMVFRRHSKTGSELERYITDGHKPISPVVRLEDSSGQSSYSGDESIANEENFNRNYLKFKSLLGEGNFGQVWKAEADDLTGHLGTTRIVAVKTERGSSKDGEHGGLKDEAEVMKKLGSHINVVTLLGACLEKGIFKEILLNHLFENNILNFRTTPFDNGICNERKIIITASSR